jgi:hypothetical protein
MSGKKQSFKDILRDSFPVNVDGLLGEPEQAHPTEKALSSGETVPPEVTVSQPDTVAPGDTVALGAPVPSPVPVASDATVTRGDTPPRLVTVSPPATAIPRDTVSPLATVSSHDSVASPDQVNILSNYFRMDADVFDVLPKVQNSYEQSVYRYLYRKSYGHGSSTCLVGLKSLTEGCQLSKNTVRKTLDTLEAKRHILRLDRLNERDQKGTIYRVFLPCEIPGLQSRTTFQILED